MIVPIAASVSIYLLLVDQPGGGSELGAAVTIGGVAAVVAALYALAVWSRGVGVGNAVAGYVLAAALTVPWGYTLLFSALIIACRTGGTCLS